MIKLSTKELKKLLEEKVALYNRPSFITEDPISVPHQYSKLQDIEIAAFFTAMFSWGQRKTIINKSRELMALMDNAPYDFILQHKERDLKRFLDFKHRTFQPDDALYFISFLNHYYRQHNSLETAFVATESKDVKSRLTSFHELFFSLPHHLQRTKKHVSTPARNSSCKRLNMFLRWMVRKDDFGVDFGIWDSISPSSLMIPLDVHVFKVAHHLGLLKRSKSDWQAVEELTANLRSFDDSDPVRYDFALFSIGVIEKN